MRLKGDDRLVVASFAYLVLHLGIVVVDKLVLYILYIVCIADSAFYFYILHQLCILSNCCFSLARFRDIKINLGYIINRLYLRWSCSLKFLNINCKASCSILSEAHRPYGCMHLVKLHYLSLFFLKCCFLWDSSLVWTLIASYTTYKPTELMVCCWLKPLFLIV